MTVGFYTTFEESLGVNASTKVSFSGRESLFSIASRFIASLREEKTSLYTSLKEEKYFIYFADFGPRFLCSSNLFLRFFVWPM